MSKEVNKEGCNVDEVGEDVDREGEDKEDDVELSLTGVALGNIVLKAMKKLNLNLENCISIGADACAVNISEKCGAVNEIKKEAKNAAMVLCMSHKLNSSLMKSSNIQSIQKVSNIIREVTKFFQNAHPKRSTALSKILGHKLKSLCDTRWVERHDSVLQFVADFPRIIEALNKVCKWNNRETAGKATVLIAALSSFDFVIGLFCLSDVLSLTRPLSVSLQKEDMDFANASQKIESLISVLADQRQEVEEKFKQIFTDATKLAEELNIEVKKPRTTGRQVRRENHDTSNCEDYFRVSMYIPLLENIIEDLKTRFSQEILEGFQLCSLLPKNIKDLTSNEITHLINCLIQRFCNLLKEAEKLLYLRLKGEMTHWQYFWKQKTTNISKENSEIPLTALETLELCDKDVYPTIHALLRILCTMCVTNASAERSFSTLRRLKTWLRTAMLQQRLVGLALLNIHHDIEVKPEDIIERFANLGAHRIVL
ncbi:PREDICTED: 52 kDa repressor of the inhibitor of the protein kinase-like [Rhagoletis zephyria]|uniref:52 kDa repressor of the inhibitor of the protein kinase-like n=1 Tax=Rhagoletis zephyria TaxID=28612 RepID=UPI0008116DB3|nr:PREDICTED: 52 kDa repressor of the inhibitor of the protein kinase-like [Rhagoletis zephyria]